MIKCSDIITGEQASNLWSSSEYSGNNAWIFNATNGTLNNNNKMNGNSVRGSLDFDCEEEWFRQFVGLYSSLLDDYRDTRKHKRGKVSQLLFEFNLQRKLLPLCWSLLHMEYIPQPSKCFPVVKPTLRQVIAAEFSDRIPQTRLVKRLMPVLEGYFFLPNSYSCRKGKGALAAVRQLMENIKHETRLFTSPAYIYKFDIRGFFMSLDPDVFYPVVVDIIERHFTGKERDENMYLARVIYLSLPQDHCIKTGDPLILQSIPERKSIIGKTVGFPLGNTTSQMICLVATTLILRIIDKFNIPSVLYTDDDCGVVTDTANFMKVMAYLKKEIKERYRLEIHPDKFYLQYYKKTVNFLGFKVKYGRLLLPGNRLVNGFKWRVACAIRKAELRPNYIFKAKESFVGAMCSYLGLLCHTASYNLRKQQMELLMTSRWGKVLDVDRENYSKVWIREEYTVKAYYKTLNRKRKQQLKKYYHELTAIAA